MRANARTADSTKPRRALTTTEIILTIAGLLLVAALLLPALNRSRSGSRRTQCIDHQRNVTVAIMNYLTTHTERLPSLRGDVSIDHDALPGTTPLRAPWSVAILPQLDNRALYDQLTIPESEIVLQGRKPLPFSVLREMRIAGYTCPDDPRHEQPGSLSYVVNTGYVLESDWRDAAKLLDGPNLTSIDWKNDADDRQHDRFSESDIDISRAAGVFLDLQSLDRPQRWAEIYDGVSSTVLLTENLDAGGWADADLQSIGFGVPIAANDRVPRFLGNGQPNQSLAPQPGFMIGDGAINSSRGESAGLPRPSSHHADGVMMSFCDGRISFVSDDIDERVYAEILTPSGSRYGQRVITIGEIGH